MSNSRGALQSIADLVTRWRESRKTKDEEEELSQLAKILRQQPSEVRKRLEGLQAIPSLDRKLRADALLLLGETEAYGGELDKAMQHSSESLSLLEELRAAEELSDDEVVKIGVAFNNIGFVFRLHGEWDKALLYYEKSLRISRAEKEKADVLVNIGNIYRLTGDFSKALSYCKHSLFIRRRINIPHDVGLSLNTLGMIYTGLWTNSVGGQKPGFSRPFEPKMYALAGVFPPQEALSSGKNLVS